MFQTEQHKGLKTETGNQHTSASGKKQHQGKCSQLPLCLPVTGSPGHISIPATGGEWGRTFLPWGRVAAALAPKFPLGEEYLELGRGDLSLAACQQVRVAGPTAAVPPAGAHCMPAACRCRSATHPPSLRFLWAVAQLCRRAPPHPPQEEGESREPPTPPLLRLPWVISPSPTHCIRKGTNYGNSIRGIWKHDAGCRERTVRAITSDYSGLGQAGEQRVELWLGQAGLCLSPTATSRGLGWWWGTRRRKANTDHFSETQVQKQS